MMSEGAGLEFIALDMPSSFPKPLRIPSERVAVYGETASILSVYNTIQLTGEGEDQNIRKRLVLKEGIVRADGRISLSEVPSYESNPITLISGYYDEVLQQVSNTLVSFRHRRHGRLVVGGFYNENVPRRLFPVLTREEPVRAAHLYLHVPHPGELMQGGFKGENALRRWTATQSNFAVFAPDFDTHLSQELQELYTAVTRQSHELAMQVA
jgi:hypothetical protein